MVSAQIIEVIVMETCGSNQEEKLMSQLQKAIVAFMHYRRKEWSFS